MADFPAVVSGLRFRLWSALALSLVLLNGPMPLAVAAGDDPNSPAVSSDSDLQPHVHAMGREERPQAASQAEQGASTAARENGPYAGAEVPERGHRADTGYEDDAHSHGRAGEHDDHAEGHGEFPEVRLSAEQRRMIGLETAVLRPSVLGETLNAPGEVQLNAYATAQVTPRIPAQVTARHARLGEEVERGQALVTLSSVDMAEAQGDLVVAERVWQRLTKLKGQFVSESDYLEASVARQKALSRVLAYGMTQAQVDALVAGASDQADGSFALLAPQSGTLVRDGFILGELVEPGRVLFEITDESVRWVEARMPPGEVAKVAIGAEARVAYRDSWLDGRVSQLHHLLDEATRTQAVRIEVPDPAHRLHPGVFVDVVIVSGDGEPVLALPETAVSRSADGDWQVFVAVSEDSFRPVEVEVLATAAGSVVIDGLAAGTRVVTRGAFFLQSELAKGGFDPHSH